jgi:lipopolysaccharide transport system permease protein
MKKPMSFLGMIFRSWGALGLIQTLWARRQLLSVLVKRDLQESYRGSMFSRFWAVLMPLTIISLSLFIVGMVFAPRLGADLPKIPDYVTFLLAGLCAWLTIQSALLKSASSLIGAANLVKQVVFPVELLPVRSVLSAFLPLLIGIVVLTIYVFARFGVISPLLPLAPVVAVLLCIMLIGYGLLFSGLTVFVRDTRDVLQLFSTVGLFVSPVIYVPGALPSWFETLLAFNPFSYAVWASQDVFFFKDFTRPSAWAVLVLISPLIFILGFWFFERTRQHFGDAF